MSKEDDELERMRKMMPPVEATPSHEPLPGADEALATGQRIRVMKQNRKTQPGYRTVEGGEIANHGNIAKGTHDNPHDW
jgi:hypothetical protein